MKLLVEVEVNKEYGDMDNYVLEELRERIDEDLVNYLTAYNENGEEVSLEILEISNVSVVEDSTDEV